MTSFSIDRSLLNPKFEGYKLDSLLQEDAVARYRLSRKPTQSTASGRAPLSFQEMRSRITHNHLALHAESRSALYVDEAFNVCLVGIPGAVNSEPSFRIIYEIATPIESSSAVNVQREYPSSAFLNATIVAVSDGNGLLYILPIKDNAVSKPIGTFTLQTGGAVNSPFKLHHIFRASATTIVLLLSSRVYPDQETSPAATTGNNHKSIEFEIWAVKIELLSLRPGSPPRDLQVLWHRCGKDVPIYVEFIREVESYLIIGQASYPDPNITKVKSYEPTPDEFAPIPRANENLDSSTSGSQLETIAKPPLYSWTQTPDSVTVAFPLPSNAAKEKIKVLFTVQTLTLHVDYPSQESNLFAPIPHFSTTAFWDSVNTSSCFWTWDREGESSYGLLTLHMEKKNEGTRWMQVFAHSTSNNHPDVPETLDPSELWNIRESLEKYTASLTTGEDASGLGLGRGVPSLGSGEIDEEADAAIGREAWVTWVNLQGQTPAWLKNEGQEWGEEPITLLSTPMQGLDSANVQLIVKQDLDGAVFSLVNSTNQPSASSESSSSSSNLNVGWHHTRSYSALAFVLASKQDIRFTHHLPTYGVMGFEGGSLRDRGANVYIYRPTVKPKDKWAKQAVLQIDNGSGGALLGVGFIGGGGEEKKEGDMVVCLTEGELILIGIK